MEGILRPENVFLQSHTGVLIRHRKPVSDIARLVPVHTGLHALIHILPGLRFNARRRHLAVGAVLGQHTVPVAAIGQLRHPIRLVSDQRRAHQHLLAAAAVQIAVKKLAVVSGIHAGVAADLGARDHSLTLIQELIALLSRAVRVKPVAAVGVLHRLVNSCSVLHHRRQGRLTAGPAAGKAHVVDQIAHIHQLVAGLIHRRVECVQPVIIVVVIHAVAVFAKPRQIRHPPAGSRILRLVGRHRQPFPLGSGPVHNLDLFSRRQRGAKLLILEGVGVDKVPCIRSSGPVGICVVGRDLRIHFVEQRPVVGLHTADIPRGHGVNRDLGRLVIRSHSL